VPRQPIFPKEASFNNDEGENVAMNIYKLFKVAVVGIGLGGTALSAAAKDVAPPPGDWGPGDVTSDFIGISGVSGQGDLTREYKVHVPKGYNKASPTPLVFCLHGVGQTTDLFCVNGTNTTGSGPNGSSGGIYDQSDKDGYILVMPQGYKHSWNGGNCCGAAARKNLDDVSLMRAIYDVVRQHLNVDATRVYAVGFSNGGFMADRLACEASDLFAAVFEGSGGIRTTPMSACTPKYNIAVLGTHGEGGKDLFVPYQGDADSMAQFASANGCSNRTVPATSPKSVGDGTQDGDVTCVTYTGCPSNTEVTFCSVQNGGHCWYGSPSCGSGAGTLGANISLGRGVNTQNIVDSNEFWPFLSKYHR
jgi:polyhydroxybutyrate depolymerase